MSAGTLDGEGEKPAPIIVKKVIVDGGDGHHGGAWKVAYADFVTAMMAFFLMLWLLGATTEDQRKGLADYFTPTLVKIRQQSAGSDGLLGGASLTDVDNYQHAQGQTGTETITIPLDTVGGPKEGAGKIKRVRKSLEEQLGDRPGLETLLRQVRMVETTEGIRIDLVDDADFSMFSLGTTVLTDSARSLVEALAKSLSAEDGNLVVRGHTDAVRWKEAARANNWSLSTSRAEATRQALMRHGLPQTRFTRIEGVADREPLIPDNPTDPRNRRISIFIAN
ncbi:flagellar motor protein MotB [Sphingomicrobium astaxanthinifaciens]|uniref:flagellar motor protein MotB n=1 Tax=Sphingomicrobium astaxanthinifaciens TaxID=1227949 RepID=UPI001FCCABAB|nr:flagellar motor protein MotB [Sphingomicrobium astaxanthinifaciens]MCJ7420371.1 OmpA family protein [Sphingomicrobium astaxanthinifaciens]